METRKCPRCEASLSLDNFSVSRSRASGYQPYCIACMKGYRKEHYNKNKDAYHKRSKAQEAELRQLAQEARDSPCMDCGCKYPYYVMDFDHRNPDTKIAAVSALIKNGNRQGLLDEIAKCDVVCSNCHRLRTHKHLA